MRLRAGELDRLVTILRRTTGARDASGAPTVTWSEQPTIHAARKDVSDGERMQADGVSSHLRARFLVRTEDGEGVSALDRIRDEDASETFEVVGVKRMGFEALEITAGLQADG